VQRYVGRDSPRKWVRRHPSARAICADLSQSDHHCCCFPNTGVMPSTRRSGPRFDFLGEGLRVCFDETQHRQACKPWSVPGFDHGTFHPPFHPALHSAPKRTNWPSNTLLHLQRQTRDRIRYDTYRHGSLGRCWRGSLVDPPSSRPFSRLLAFTSLTVGLFQAS